MALKAFGKMQKRSLKEWLVYNEDTWNLMKFNQN
jgi:hypothetical protein